MLRRFGAISPSVARPLLPYGTTGQVDEPHFSRLAVAQVALNSCAMTNCGLILESILEHASDFVSEAEEARFISASRDFLQRSALGLSCVQIWALKPGMITSWACRC